MPFHPRHGFPCPLTGLHGSHVDHTSFFRAVSGAARGNSEPARSPFLDLVAFDAWLQRWRGLGPDAEGMDRVNPIYIPRNHLVERLSPQRPAVTSIH